MSEELFGYALGKSWDYENGYFLTSHSSRLAKAIAQYELYKTISGLPGHVVECGVFKGTSLLRFCTYREICETSFSRKIIGFDAFGEFPSSTHKDDLEFIARFASTAGSGISKSELERCLQLKGFENVELIQGDINQTVPSFVELHPELKIAMLHIDVDVYEPTKCALEKMFRSLVTGGLLVLDDYGTVSGATRAVDEYFAGSGYRIEKLPISHIPCFIRV
jgi:hypothetical protein